MKNTQRKHMTLVITKDPITGKRDFYQSQTMIDASLSILRTAEYEIRLPGVQTITSELAFDIGRWIEQYEQSTDT